MGQRRCVLGAASVRHGVVGGIGENTGIHTMMVLMRRCYCEVPKGGVQVSAWRAGFVVRGVYLGRFAAAIRLSVTLRRDLSYLAGDRRLLCSRYYSRVSADS